MATSTIMDYSGGPSVTFTPAFMLLSCLLLLQSLSVRIFVTPMQILIWPLAKGWLSSRCDSYSYIKHLTCNSRHQFPDG